MAIVFYISAIVALLASAMVITRTHAVHALLYLVVSLFALAMVFYALGAPFVAALEVIVYAGAIMVLFVFVVMMLNLGSDAAGRGRVRLSLPDWIGPAILAGLLAIELVFVAFSQGTETPATVEVSPKQVGTTLFGPYLLGVELASFLLLTGVVAAYHVGRRQSREDREGLEK